MASYGVVNPSTMRFSGPDMAGNYTLVAAAGGDELVISASAERWNGLMIRPPESREVVARGMYERGEITLERFEAILEGKR